MIAAKPSQAASLHGYYGRSISVDDMYHDNADGRFLLLCSKAAMYKGVLFTLGCSYGVTDTLLSTETNILRWHRNNSYSRDTRPSRCSPQTNSVMDGMRMSVPLHINDMSPVRLFPDSHSHSMKQTKQYESSLQMVHEDTRILSLTQRLQLLKAAWYGSRKVVIIQLDILQKSRIS